MNEVIEALGDNFWANRRGQNDSPPRTRCVSSSASLKLGKQQRALRPDRHGPSPRVSQANYFTSSNSPGFQVLSNHGSSGP